MKQLGKTDLTSRAWASTNTPGLIRLRLGTQDYQCDRSEAIALAQALVAAVDQCDAGMEAEQ